MLYVVLFVLLVAVSATHMIFGEILFGYYWALWRNPTYRSLKGFKQWWLERTTNECKACSERYKKRAFIDWGYCEKHEYLHFEHVNKLAREQRINDHIAHLEEKREAILRFRMQHATTYRVAAEEEEVL